MKCYACNCRLSPDRDTCPKCGADIRLYRKIIYASNQYYNLGLARAKARDLTGAAECLRTSLQLYKKNISARNLLGLVYYEMGEKTLPLAENVVLKDSSADPQAEAAETTGASAVAAAINADPDNWTVYNTTLVVQGGKVQEVRRIWVP